MHGTTYVKPKDSTRSWSIIRSRKVFLHVLSFFVNLYNS